MVKELALPSADELDFDIAAWTRCAFGENEWGKVKREGSRY